MRSRRPFCCLVRFLLDALGRLCMVWRSQVLVELSGALDLRCFLKYLVLSFRPLLGHDHKRCTAIVLHRESPRPFHFGAEMTKQDTTLACCMDMRKADSTLRSSRAVPHPSTNRALRRLTSEVRRDPVHSTRYGRQRNYIRASRQPTTFPRRADSQELLRLASTSHALQPEASRWIVRG